MAIEIRGVSLHRLIFIGIIILPALVTQTIVPMISHESWEGLSDAIYPQLLTFTSTDESNPSQIAIIKATATSDQDIKSPFDQESIVTLLSQLKNAGRPYVLAMTALPTSPQKIGTEKSDVNLALANAISDYGKFIGSPLELVEANENLGPELQELLTKVAFTRSGAIADDIGNQPIRITEPIELVKAEKTFGFKPIFSGGSASNCFQAYIGDEFGDLAIPTALLWSAAYATQASLALGNGAIWPRKGEKIQFPFKRKLEIGDKQCLTDPNLSTNDYLNIREIKELELSSALHGTLPDLKDKIVILTVDDGARIIGPGTNGTAESVLTADYQLAARFLDGFLTGNTIKRQRLIDQRHYDGLPVLIAMMLVVLSFVLSTSTLAFLSLLSFLALLGYSTLQVYLQSRYTIPIQSMTSALFATLGIILSQSVLKLYGVSRLKRYAENLETAFGKCVSLDEIIVTAMEVSRTEFQLFELSLTGYNQSLYHAASSEEHIIAYLNKFGISAINSEPSKFADTGKLSTVLTTVKPPPDAGRLALGARGITARIAIHTKEKRLGTAEILLSYRSEEEIFVADMINLFQRTLSHHWERIDTDVRKKFMEATATSQ